MRFEADSRMMPLLGLPDMMRALTYPLFRQCHQVGRYTPYDCTRLNEVAAGGYLCYEQGL